MRTLVEAPSCLVPGAKLAVHLVGIGGTGMRGLARVLRGMGMDVSGSDRDGVPAALEKSLSAAGIRISAGSSAGNVPPGAGLIVATAAARPEENPECREAARRGLPVLKYAEAVAQVVRARKLVAVAGSHGKTTTSSMIAWLLKAAGVSESFLVGGQVRGIGESGWWGKGDHFVLEACEYDRSFLNYDPAVAVVTNVDADHMDYYKTMEALREAFAAFVRRTSPEGRVILCADDAPSLFLAEAAPAAVWTAGFSPSADWRIAAHALSPQGGTFRLEGPPGGADFRLPLCGIHNLRNAAQAVAAASACGASLDALREALAAFQGAERRMHLLGTVRGAPVLDDYGHHPAELAATFASVRQRYPGRRLRVAFQPHQYARTEYLFDDFVRVLASGPDDLLLAPVYGARHDGSAPKADSGTLRDAVARAGGSCRLLSLDGMVDELGRAAEADDVILVIGAGDIGRVGHDLIGRYGAVEGA